MMLFNDDTNIADTKCMERIQAGDESGLTELMGRYSRRLRGYMSKRNVSEEAQDEILQDVFLKVWSRLDTFMIGAVVSRWLFAIARNAMFDAMRKMKRRNRDVILLSQLLQYTESSIEDGYECLEAVEDASVSDKTLFVDDIIEAASEVLEPRYLEEVVAMYRGGSAEERSRETGECASTLRWRRSEALAQLRSSGKFTKQFANAFVD